MNRPNPTTKGIALTLLAVTGIYAFARASKVAPLSEADKKAKTCEVHGDDLQLGTALVLYGDRPPVIRDPAAQNQFPRARSWILGGCVVFPDSPQYQQVKFCSDCRQAEAKWMADHHIAPPKD